MSGSFGRHCFMTVQTLGKQKRVRHMPRYNRSKYASDSSECTDTRFVLPHLLGLLTIWKVPSSFSVAESVTRISSDWYSQHFEQTGLPPLNFQRCSPPFEQMSVIKTRSVFRDGRQCHGRCRQAFHVDA